MIKTVCDKRNKVYGYFFMVWVIVYLLMCCPSKSWSYKVTYPDGEYELTLWDTVRLQPQKSSSGVIINGKYYGPENFCGAAVAQMIMDSYPDPITDPNTPPRFNQNEIFYNPDEEKNSIVEFNKEGILNEKVLFATDPYGLSKAITTLHKPEGIYGIVSNIDRKKALYRALYWMAKLKKYPGATLIRAGGHWVTIVGFRTDKDPSKSPSVKLRQIHIYDPLPIDIGVKETVLANTWYNWEKGKLGDEEYSSYWKQPVKVKELLGTSTESQWRDKYICVVEPIEVDGDVQIDKRRRVRLAGAGGALKITNKIVKQRALSAIKEINLSSKEPYILLKNEGISPKEPLFVNGNNPYYLVPFGYDNSYYSQINVILDKECNFLKIGALGIPCRYFSRDEAIERALKQYPGNKVQAELVHTMNSHWPVWEVTIDDSNKVIIEPQPVPEPCTMLLMGSGLVGLAGIARRRRRRS